MVHLVCGLCGSRRIGTVSRRARGLYYESSREDTSLLAIDLAHRARSLGRPYDRSWEPVLRLKEPSTAPIDAGRQRVHALLDFYAEDSRGMQGSLTAFCPKHDQLSVQVPELLAVVRRHTGGRPLRHVVTAQR